ncbi:glycosyltransferase [Halobacillus mangrovi]|uniref:glycosyltransferase n=1 Tax=Halobacillus mangrovi TaxID=402384 RepID=UPI003D985E0D
MNRNEILSRLQQVRKLKKELDTEQAISLPTKTPQPPVSNFKDGVSVIIPTYQGEEVIEKCLNSLHRQTLSKELFEVIIVMNGEKDSTEYLIQKFMKRNNMNNISMTYSSIASASSARNIGINRANRKYSLFLDDDDYLSDNYLEKMLSYATPENIVYSQIINVDAQGKIDAENPINKQIKKAAEQNKSDFPALSMVATINACKLVPTHAVKKVKYDHTLKSGEDIVYFMDLFVENDLDFKVAPIEDEVNYYRVLRDNSVSRQGMTFDFFIRQRLDVIACLDRMLGKTNDQAKITFIRQKIHAQSAFLNRYLKENRDERDQVMEEIKKRELSYIPYPIINRGLAKKLVISYCFPPYVDTAANVMAKRIRNMDEVVDVVYNKMDKVRKRDDNVSHLVNDLIEERIEIPSYPSFSNWKAINHFSDLASKKINAEKKYDEVYSRAMWPGSHILAYKYKIENPEVKWVAEFSDPLLLDIHGKVREAKIEDEDFLKQANKLIKKRFNLPAVKDSNLFLWCEYLPYLFADELVFTNENQLKYMIDSFPIKQMKKIVMEKAVVSAHPQVDHSYYELKDTAYQVDEEHVNFAYFGNFYSTRNLDDLFVGLENVSQTVRDHVKLHIFTGDPTPLREDLKGSEIEDHVEVNPYVSYTEFLNLTTKFDCLVVNDAKTKDSKPLNPYLPSKLSDYIGSGSKIWGIYEEGSILSRYPLSYKSELGNIEQATGVFEKAVNEKKDLLVTV